MDARIMAMRMERWREILVACNTSGMKKKEWMRIHNVSPKMFYRKQKQLREYEMEKASLTSADKPAGQKSTEFFDLTTALTRQTSEISARAWTEPINSIPQKQITPEIMIQAGSYNLYIGSGVTEATLSTVLRVISHA